MEDPGYQCTQSYLDYQKYAKKYGYTSFSQKKYGSEVKEYCDKIDKKVNGKTMHYYKLKQKYVDKIEEVINEEDIRDFSEF